MGRAKRCRNDPFFLYTFLGSKCLYYFFSNSYFIELFCVSIQRCQLTIFLKKTCLPPWFPKYSTKPKTKKLKKKKISHLQFLYRRKANFFFYFVALLYTHILCVSIKTTIIIPPFFSTSISISPLPLSFSLFFYFFLLPFQLIDIFSIDLISVLITIYYSHVL